MHLFRNVSGLSTVLIYSTLMTDIRPLHNQLGRKDDQSLPSKHAICEILRHQNKWGALLNRHETEFIRAKQGKTRGSARTVKWRFGKTSSFTSCLHIPACACACVYTYQLLLQHRTLDCCWCFTKVTFSLSALTQIFAGALLPEQWRLVPFVSSISLPTIAICNARGLITSWETAEPPRRLFEQLENENKVLRAGVETTKL